MPDVPQDFAELITRWDEIKADLALVRQLAKLKVITGTGEVTLQTAPGGDNAVLDIRDIVAPAFALPKQSGNEDKFLRTDGERPSWQDTPAGGLPDQTGNAGKYLQTDGTDASWQDQAAGGYALPDQTGNTGKVLTSNGSLGSETWETPAGGGGGGGATFFTRIALTANQVLNLNSFKDVSWDTALNNTYGLWSAGTPKRITVPTGGAGLWLVTCQMKFENDGYIRNGYKALEVYLNDSDYICGQYSERSTVNNENTYISCSGVILMADGDYAVAYVGTGNEVDTTNGAISYGDDYTSWLSMVRIGDTPS